MSVPLPSWTAASSVNGEWTDMLCGSSRTGDSKGFCTPLVSTSGVGEVGESFDIHVFLLLSELV